MDERREEIAKALFNAFRDGFEEAYGERPEGWGETSEDTREVWREEADALLPTEGEPDAWREQAHKAVDHFGELPENWDSYGAEPPSENVRFLAHKVVDGVESIQRVAPFSGGIVVEISPDLAIWCEDDEPDDARAATPQESAEVERLRSVASAGLDALVELVENDPHDLLDKRPCATCDQAKKAIADLRATLNTETDG